jgi:hypothetical protein
LVRVRKEDQKLTDKTQKPNWQSEICKSSLWDGVTGNTLRSERRNGGSTPSPAAKALPIGNCQWQIFVSKLKALTKKQIGNRRLANQKTG